MDKLTTQILKLFYYNEFLRCENVSSILQHDIETVSKSCLFLRSHNYIHTNDPTQHDDEEIYSDSFYIITVEGKACYEAIIRDNRRFRIPVMISIVALAISAISLAVSIVLR